MCWEYCGKKGQYVMDIKLTARCSGLTGALTSESFKMSVPEVSISLTNQTHVLQPTLPVQYLYLTEANFVFNSPHLEVFHWQSVK